MGWLGNLLGKGFGLASSFIPGGSVLKGAIGAGVGALGGILGRGKEDPRYAANTGYLNQLQGLPPPQTAGVDPYSQQAFGLMQGLATNGPNIAQFQNPYESQVLGGMQRDIAGARTSALNAANDQATKQGVFGSRSGLMGAAALGAVNKAGLNQMGQFRYQGFNDAVNNAQEQQQFGLQSAQALAGAGDYSRSVTQAGYDAPFNRLMAMGPQVAGQLYAGQGYQQRPGVLQSALGGALTGFGLFKQGPQGPSSAVNSWLNKPKVNIGAPQNTGIGGGFRGYP